MLLELAQWLAQDIRGFNVFNYITLRAVLAAMTALIISFVAGPRVIRWLAAKKIGQAVRQEGPQTHLVKSGTPTMGGALILISIAVTTLLWGDLSNRYIWVLLIVTLGFGAIGWYDDWKKVVYRDPRGLASRWKYFWQSVIGLVVAVYLALTASVDILKAIAGGGGPRDCLHALGYAGWAPGQLEDEIQRNAWLSVPADEALVFGADTTRTWEAALAKLRIDPALLSGTAGHA